MTGKMRRRNFLKGPGLLAAGAVLGPLAGRRRAHGADTVKVGILHSLTGTIAIAEAC